MEHNSLESCKDYLPKAKRRHKAVIVRCPKCKTYFVGDITIRGKYCWSEINLGRKKK